MTVPNATPAVNPLPGPWLGRFTKLLVGATLILIFLGGQVKSNDAGLAVPDWPNSFGVNMFLFHWSNWYGGIFHEHVHRLVASSIGMLTIILVAWLALRESREWVRLLGFIALIAVILQGILGGLTVIFLLPTAISLAHAVLAQTFFMLTIVIAYSLSREWAERRPDAFADARKSIAKSALLLMAVVYVQLILGALMRHTESGLAIPDFPTTGGRMVPWFNEATLDWINAWRMNYSIDHAQMLEPVTMGQVLIHFAHRLGALAVLTATAIFARRAYRERKTLPQPWNTACVLIGLLGIQVSLGAMTIWTQRVPVIASLHVVVGAAVLGVTT
ncbi:MAG: COX15/CtaA family protein, partial [Candidatus Hydrogenedentes bacterium]|nr:COX15/CtaA family protein [Candidatus Hydrogenedentota bacterium]